MEEIEINTELTPKERQLLDEIAALQHVKEEAEAASRAKSTFLANMSHEIRTPMNAILGMSNLLSLTELTDQQRGYVHNILAASESLISFIDDILDISSIDAQKFQINAHEYVLADLIGDVMNVISLRAAEKNLTLIVDMDPHLPAWYWGDDLRIKQVLVNVLTNAVKYTREGTVSLSISQAPVEDGVMELIFAVEDTGIGIREEEIPNVFRVFSKMDSQGNHPTPGKGLGLAISKGIVASMGGDIDVKSMYGKGSLFTVRIPQRYMGDNKLAEVSDPAQKLALIFGKGVAADSLERMLSSLFVKYTYVKTTDAFEQAIEKQTYSHLFYWYEIGGEAVRKARHRLNDTVRIAVKSLSTIEGHEHSNVLYEPLLLSEVANILNSHAARLRDMAAMAAGKLGSFKVQNARALIVDDNEINLLVAQEMLKVYELAADIADGGREAIRLCGENRYDIIFMDQMMPEMDGIEATWRIRQIAGYDDTPIIALTANAVIGMKEQFLSSGLDDYLTKPIDVGDLNRVLLGWLPEDSILRSEAAPVPAHAHAENTASSPILREIASHCSIAVTEALKQIGGSEETYLLILKTFCNNAEKKLSILRSSLAAGDLNSYRIEIHGQRSAMNNIGMPRLSEKARKLELAAEKSAMDYIKANSESYIHEVEAFAAQVNSLMPSEEMGGERKAATESDQRNMVGSLRGVVRLLDLLECDAALKMLKAVLLYDYGAAINQDLERALGAIDNFDYDMATSIIKALIDQGTEGAEA